MPILNNPPFKFESVFNFEDLEESVTLRRGEIEIVVDNNAYKTQGEVCVETIPSSGVYFYGVFQGVPLLSNASSLRFDGQLIDGFTVQNRANSEGKQTIKWRPRSGLVNGYGDKSTQMSYLIGHVFNFPEYTGTRCSGKKTSDGVRHAIFHVDLAYGQC